MHWRHWAHAQRPGQRTICRRIADWLPLRQEMELPRNQFSCMATRGVPGPRALGDTAGDRPGECGSLWWSNTSYAM